MSLKYALLATEGLTDQAVLCGMLRLFGLQQFRGERKLLGEQHLFWERFFPKPSIETNVYERLDMQVPRIFTSQTHSVAVYQGFGSNLLQNVADIMDGYKPYARNIHAFGLFIDADTNLPSIVTQKCASRLRNYFPDISTVPGTISASSPRTGIYVFPDNEKHGTLDSLLVHCAEIVYPDHKAGAMKFLDSLDISHKSHWKPFDYEKAVIASIVSVIQPGIASHLSLVRTRDKWIGAQTTKVVTELISLKQFIADLLELSLTEPTMQVFV